MEPKLDPKKYCSLYIVRHGQTDWNVKKRIQGHQDIDLNQTGKDQAKKAAKRFKGIKFEAIFSSDLLRAKKTTKIIALEHNLAVKTTKALRERAFGRFEGKTGGQFREELREILAEYNQLTDKQKFSFKFPSGIENYQSVMARVITFLREISVAYPNKNALIGTHGGVMRHLLIHLGYASTTQLPPHSINNLAHIKLLSDGVDFFVKETHGVNLKNES